MKEELKSEFVSKMEKIAKQVTDLAKNDPKKSIIIIATDSNGKETRTITVVGHGNELKKGLADFIAIEKCRRLLLLSTELAQEKIKRGIVEEYTEEDI